MLNHAPRTPRPIARPPDAAPLLDARTALDATLELLRRCADGGDEALASAAALLARTPPVAYVLLEVPGSAGAAGLRIECAHPASEPSVAYLPSLIGNAPPRPPTPEHWQGASVLSPRLVAHGLLEAVRSPLEAWPGASVTLGAREQHTVFEAGPALDLLASAIAVLDGALARRRLDAELQRLDRLRLATEMTSVIVHDFNNALTAIIACVDTVRSTLPPDHEAQRGTKMIETLALGAAGLAHQLLGFVRGSDDGGGSIDVNALVEECAILGRQAVARGIDVRADLGASAPVLRGSRSLLQQALLNLVLNASDAMPGGGSIELRTRLEGDEVAISVRDEGEGVAPEVLPHIFDPFFTTRQSKGSGLGLASVSRVARRFGGRVEVETEPGAGSTFTLRLPLDPAAE